MIPAPPGGYHAAVRSCYVAFGSNLGDRRAHLARGLAALSARGLRPVAVSSVHETEPVDAEGGRFLNLVARIDTAMEPRALLDVLLGIEAESGRRRRDTGDGPSLARRLDLDLLLAGELVVDEPGLVVPHPRMWERRFVLEPLAELAPELRDPRGGPTVAERLRRLGYNPHPPGDTTTR